MPARRGVSMAMSSIFLVKRVREINIALGQFWPWLVHEGNTEFCLPACPEEVAQCKIIHYLHCCVYYSIHDILKNISVFKYSELWVLLWIDNL